VVGGKCGNHKIVNCETSNVNRQRSWLIDHSSWEEHIMGHCINRKISKSQNQK